MQSERQKINETLETISEEFPKFRIVLSTFDTYHNGDYSALARLHVNYLESKFLEVILEHRWKEQTVKVSSANIRPVMISITELDVIKRVIIMSIQSTLQYKFIELEEKFERLIERLSGNRQ